MSRKILVSFCIAFEIKTLVNDIDVFFLFWFCYFLSIQLYLAMHFFGLMVELYRRTSRHIKSICNTSVTRFITGHLLTLIFNVYQTIWKIYGTCITQNCKMSYINYIIKYGTRYISLRTSKAYVRTSEMWK